MKHLLLGFLLAFGLLLVGPATNAAADSDSMDSDSGGISAAPEIDANLAGSAMVLLLGGVAYLASRKRKDD